MLKKEPIREIRSGLLTRGMTIVKASLQARALVAKACECTGTHWLVEAQQLIAEIGKLKGATMKVGQTLSTYGEHLFSKEVNDLLKVLQQNALPLDWQEIHQVLKEQLCEKLDFLEVNQEPLASASIGQVHRAKIKDTGEDIALKVQYPGVEFALDTDILLLKFILKASEIIPRGPRFDQIFSEIRQMLYREVNYMTELETTDQFCSLLSESPVYRVPKVYRKFSTHRVLALEYIDGFRADSPEVQGLHQDRRNRIGLKFLELYFKELFEFRKMQTDGHLGNYRIQIDPEGINDRLVLFDFGAVRDIPQEFLRSYSLMVEGSFFQDTSKLEEGSLGIGLMQPEDDRKFVNVHHQLCMLLTEPFRSDVYDWGASDLPLRVTQCARQLKESYRLRAPPRELVFLDRKMGGVYTFLSVLKCRMDVKPIIVEALERYKSTRES